MCDISGWRGVLQLMMYFIIYLIFNSHYFLYFFFFSSRRRHTRLTCDWSSDVCSSDLCKHVRSNAIVLAKNLATIGIGAGQMSRVDSVELAIRKARRSLDGAAMASEDRKSVV